MSINLVKVSLIFYCQWFDAMGEVMYREPYESWKALNNMESRVPYPNFKYQHETFPPKSSQQINHHGGMKSQPLTKSELSRKPTSFLEEFVRAIDNMAEEGDEKPNNMDYAVRTPYSENRQASFRQWTPNLGQSTPEPNISPLNITSLPMPKFSVLDSTSLKAENRMSGLLSLALGLLTGSSQSSPLNQGLKDMLINGIVRPLLVAKGSLKSLISKLLVPVISLILINIEVLITVWWLWEDCSKTSSMSKVNQEDSINNFNSSFV